MTARQHDQQWDDEPDAVLSGLARLAQELDAEHCPATAWPVALREDWAGSRRAPCTRGRGAGSKWRLLLPLAATVAAVAVWALAAFRGGPPGPAPVEQRPAAQVAQSPSIGPREEGSAAEPAPSQIMVVEDMDSYSIIDLTAGAPVVSFAWKDSSSPACLLPALPEPAEQPERGSGEI